MDGNDQYGDCVIADCAHQEMLRTANAGTIWIPTQLEVLAFYAQQQGYVGDPSNLAAIEGYLQNNDNACDELTVIQYLQQTGWLGRKLDGHANLNPTQLDQVKWAVCIFGASRLGLNLPDSAMQQFGNGPWVPATNAKLDGGHDVPVVKYDGQYFYVVTWGALQPVDPSFFAAKYADGTPYLEEAHVELALDWVNAAGTAPNNLDLAQLMADLSSVTDVTPPAPPQPNPPPGPGTSKRELAKLMRTAIDSDLAKKDMTEADMKADLRGVLDAN